MNVIDQNKIRGLIQATPGTPSSDGDGVRLTRYIGTPQLDMVDPFLMLDNFKSEKRDDYIGGFPDYPHRGFETVTYLLAGRMRHRDNGGRDNKGHEGVIEPGDVQWMSAGRGIIHSEMPEQEEGLLSGFQLWVNLPASDKMKAPAYQEYVSGQIPVEKIDGGSVKIIAGITDRNTTGAVINIASNPLFLDVRLDANCVFHQAVEASHNGFIFMIEGEPLIGDDLLPAENLGVLNEGDRVKITAQVACRFLLVAGERINEPVARGGPFVMNTRAEVLQAFDDFKNGRF